MIDENIEVIGNQENFWEPESCHKVRFDEKNSSQSKNDFTMEHKNVFVLQIVSHKEQINPYLKKAFNGKSKKSL